MSNSSKIKNAVYGNDPYKQMVITRMGKNMSPTSVLYSVNSGPAEEQGTYQVAQKGNTVIRRYTKSGRYEVYIVCDNRGGLRGVNNDNLIAYVQGRRAFGFLNSDSNSVSLDPSEYLVNINKKKRFKLFEHNYGIPVSKSLYKVSKFDVRMVPQPFPENFSIPKGCNMYYSTSNGKSTACTNTDDIPWNITGLHVIVVGDGYGIRVYKKD